jgi:hypothetical protein
MTRPELEALAQKWFGQHDGMCLRSIVGQNALKHLADLLERVQHDAFQEMLRMVVGSLKGYPNAGGDIEVMTEVERIRRDAVAEERKALREVVIEVRAVGYAGIAEEIATKILAALDALEKSE